MSGVRDFRAGRGVRVGSRRDLTPLLEELARRTGASFSIEDESGRTVFTADRRLSGTSGTSESAIRLDMGGIPASLIVETPQADPATAQTLLLGEISLGVAHDINNVIAGLDANLYFMGRRGGKEAGMEDGVEDAVRQMTALTALLSAMCRRILTMGNVRHETRVANIHDIAEDSIALSRQMLKGQIASGKTVNFNNRVPDSLYCSIIVSEVQMCILNIISNAARHGFEGRGNGSISFSARGAGTFVCLDIANDGAQIPEQIRGKLLSEPLSSRCDHGYGLYNAVQRLRSFGADMSFRSDKDSTVFTLSLPCYAGG